MDDVVSADDPVAARRAQIARVVRGAKRVGYLALVVAIAAFFLGVVTQFPGWLVTVAVTGLVVACVVLPLPIVLGYGIRAAERDDRAASDRRRRARGSGGPDA
jgi:hypothetical protein